jgi:NOL1/NOP2/fmu family ribosome biogenesis protein
VEYALGVHTVGQGSVTLEPNDGIYYGGTSVEVTAAADSGWVFTEWSGDLAGSKNPETIIMNDHKEITANFDPAPRYTLMIETVGQGRVTLDPEGATYIAGTTVELTATADPGWVFSNWKGDLLGLNNPETITMNDDKDIRATFIPVPQYTLKVETIGQGDVRLVPDDGIYEAGTMVELKALPSVCGGIVGIFAGWRGDLHGSDSAATIAMDSNKMISATFVEVGAVN